MNRPRGVISFLGADCWQAAEENQNDRQNDQPMKDTELTHRNPPRALLKTALTVLQDALRGKSAAV